MLCSSLVLATSASAASAQTLWNGPLPVQNERPYQSAFLHFEPQAPEVLSPGKSCYGVAFHVANDLLIPADSNGSRVEEDFETGRVQLNYSRGIGKGWEVGARTNAIVRDNGLLDGPIEFYHRLLSLPGNGQDAPAGRENIPRNRDILFFQDANGNGVDEASASGLGDTTLEVRRQLSSGKNASAARFAVEIPTGNGSKILGSGGFDAGIGLDARHEFGSRLALFGSANIFIYGDSKIPNAQNSGIGGGLGLEFKAGKRDSILAQVDAQSRTITTGNSFADRTPVLASVGYKHRFSDNRTLFASFSEDGDFTNYNVPALGNIGPDFTLSVGMQWHH
ncbi:hypothetical protein IAD21_06177 [Abditibacteriota bacterium]|nr:hypothetical protein IAD21_06177 [Abditibacteriota bacterium]